MTRIVSAGRVAHTRPSRRTWTPGEAAASGRKNPELFTTGVSVQFLGLARFPPHIIEPSVKQEGQQNSRFKEVHW